ncbi:hypothetical protein PRUPE_6G287200 [Prunus persica]|uniref:Uncharacterized protein n=1 Tax=Prunus persica TaxID=3760 RepID=M5W5R3_PRUPE|nr:hypothetical protein PRUPE_6G287200 [Prunus persica]
MFLLSCKLITFLHRPLFWSHPHLVLGFFFDLKSVRDALSKCNFLPLIWCSWLLHILRIHTPSISSCITCVQRM